MKRILGISSEKFALFVPGDWLHSLGVGMVMFSLGDYSRKEQTFSFPVIGGLSGTTW